MFVLLLVAAALVGVLLGVMALSMMSSVTVAGLSTPHPQRPARERREHEHPDFSKREKRYPDVPPPLAPMTQTPAVLQGTAARALAPMESVFVTPSIPVVSSVLTSTPSAAPVFKTPTIAPIAAPPPPSFTAYNPPPVTAPQQFTASVGQPVAPPPLPPRAPKPMAERVQTAIDAGQAIANDAELLSLLQNGHFIAALKHYRERNGVGLAEAKAALDAWRAQAGHHEQAAQVVENVVTDPQIVAAIRKGKIIEAIKLYRAKTGVSLQDAKEAIDDWRRQLGR